MSAKKFTMTDKGEHKKLNLEYDPEEDALEIHLRADSTRNTDKAGIVELRGDEIAKLSSFSSMVNALRGGSE